MISMIWSLSIIYQQQVGDQEMVPQLPAWTTMPAGMSLSIDVARRDFLRLPIPKSKKNLDNYIIRFWRGKGIDRVYFEPIVNPHDFVYGGDLKAGVFYEYDIYSKTHKIRGKRPSSH